jgi:hypothetical protein
MVLFCPHDIQVFVVSGSSYGMVLQAAVKEMFVPQSTLESRPLPNINCLMAYIFTNIAIKYI